MNIDSRMIIKLLEDNGFKKIKTLGSHILYEHSESNTRIVLTHKKFMPLGFIKAIERQLKENGIIKDSIKEEIEKMRASRLK